MSAVLTDLRVEIESQAASAELEYRVLILALAGDEQLAPIDVMKVVTTAGKTLDQLQADVETVSRRRRIQADLDAARAEGAKRPDAQRAVLAAEAEKRQLIEEADRKILLAQQQLAVVDDADRRVKALHGELIATASPELKAAHAEAVRRRHTAAEAMNTARKKLDEVRRIVAVDEGKIPAQAKEIGERSFKKHLDEAFTVDRDGLPPDRWAWLKCRETEAEAERDLRGRIEHRLRPHRQALSHTEAAEAEAREQLAAAAAGLLLVE